MALAFVPVEDVIYAYKKLVVSTYFEEKEVLLDSSLQYFEKTWVGQKKSNGTRGLPMSNKFMELV